MKTIYFRRHKDADNIDYYLDATDVFQYASENTDKGLELYQFALMVEKYMNYWNNNTPTAFGNPDYNYLMGCVEGYITAKGWGQRETTQKEIILFKGNKKVLVIDKIEKPKSYYEAERDNIKH